MAESNNVNSLELNEKFEIDCKAKAFQESNGKQIENIAFNIVWIHNRK